MIMSRDAKALHESAHAVVAETFTNCVRCIEMDDKRKFVSASVTARHTFLSKEQQATVALAGPAQDVKGSEMFDVEPGHGEAAVHDVADGIDDVLRSDILQAKDAVGRDRILGVWAETKELVEKKSEVIEHVASTLLCTLDIDNCTRLDGLAVREIVNQY